MGAGTGLAQGRRQHRGQDEEGNGVGARAVGGVGNGDRMGRR